MNFMFSIKWRILNLIRPYISKYLYLKYYTLLIEQKQRDKYKSLNRAYFIKEININNIIFKLDRDIWHIGIADVINGLISTFYIAKEHNIEFKLYLPSPFVWEDYLIPNKYNWLIDSKDIYLNNHISKICFLPAIKGFDEKDAKIERSLYIKKLISTKNQRHASSNVDIINNNEIFSKLFNELFKPSPQLQEQLNKRHSEVRDKYISISFRFMNLLGDFEADKIEQLNQKEKDLLIEKCKKSIEVIHKSHPKIKKILLTSDSNHFIDCCQNINYIYTVPGDITHSGISGNSQMKTFIDFLMISNAEKAFLVIGPKMYKSGFAKTAAKVGNIPFEIMIL